MITYEITAAVRMDLSEKYERYMRDTHIPDVLATGFFSAATLTRSSVGRYRIRYEAFDSDALSCYLRDSAGGLREHFAQAFPEGVELTRENWDVLESWPGPERS